MKRLTLIRHAKSSWKDLSKGDFERPLNKRGKRTAPLVARHLATGVIAPPDCFLSSPARRALATAKIIVQELGYKTEDIVFEQRIYEAPLISLYEVLREVDKRCDHLMMFGHNPGFQMLAHSLSGYERENFPTCAVLSIELDIDDWAKISKGCGKEVFYLYPKDLEQK
jgi:phosphohistidine phosphatase